MTTGNNPLVCEMNAALHVAWEKYHDHDDPYVVEELSMIMDAAEQMLSLMTHDTKCASQYHWETCRIHVTRSLQFRDTFQLVVYAPLKWKNCIVVENGSVVLHRQTRQWSPAAFAAAIVRPTP